MRELVVVCRLKMNDEVDDAVKDDIKSFILSKIKSNTEDPFYLSSITNIVEDISEYTKSIDLKYTDMMCGEIEFQVMIDSEWRPISDFVYSMIQKYGVVTKMIAHHPRSDRYGVPMEALEVGARFVTAEDAGFKMSSGFEVEVDDMGDDSANFDEWTLVFKPQDMHCIMEEILK